MSVLRRFSYHAQAAAAAVLLAAACAVRVPPRLPKSPSLQHPPAPPSRSPASVRGRRTRWRGCRRLRRSGRASSRFACSAPDGAASATPVAGKYVVDGDALRFTPLFPLDGGRRTRRVTGRGGPSQGSPPSSSRPSSRRRRRPPQAPVHVTGVFPSRTRSPRTSCASTSTSPARWAGGRRSSTCALLDDKGREVVDPFLPVDGELWNADRTRYTAVLRSGPAEARHPSEPRDGPVARGGAQVHAGRGSRVDRWQRQSAARGVHPAVPSRPAGHRAAGPGDLEDRRAPGRHARRRSR